MTNEEILQTFSDITHAYNNRTKYDTLKRMLDELTEPCEDTISRQAAIDATWSEPSYTDPLNVLTEVRDRLKALPSAQPERKKGKWIRHDEIKNVYGGICIECSECGEKYVVRHILDEKYCRNCGADMRGEKDG